MTTPTAIQEILPGLVQLSPMTRAEWEQLPESVRAFLLWSDGGGLSSSRRMLRSQAGPGPHTS
jgi:hypothetical protein